MSEINKLTAVNSVTGSDQVPIYSSSNGDARKASMTTLRTFMANGVAESTHAATNKVTPVDADEFPIADSATSFSLKKLLWGNLKATLVSTWKDQSGFFVGLTLFKINFKNAANTFVSYFTNSNTASRTYTFKDRDGTIIDDTDYTTLDTAINTKVTQTSSTGSAVIPTGTTAQRDVSPQVGYTRYNTTLNRPEAYSGAAWLGMGGANGAGGDDVFYENGTTVTTSYTLTAGKNAMSTGPITINTGVVVTIPTGQRWVIL